MTKSYFVAYPKKLNNLYITITKQLSLKLILTILISMVGMKAFSYQAYIDGIYYRFYGDNAIVTYKAEYNENMFAYEGNVVIPSSVNYNSKDYSVTSIDERAFGMCSFLSSVTIPNSVTSIGNAAFVSCTNLTSITIPNSVTSIGEGAFWRCGFTSINVDANNPNYDSRDNCNAIIEKETNRLILGSNNTFIPNNVTSIGYGAFSHCTGLTSITIPNSVTSIDESAFLDCTSLTSITIPNSVTSIGNSAFSRCSHLTSVTINNGVTSIGRDVFYYCTNLTSITIPNSVTSIGQRAFYNCI